ncbi:MAG: hypothetical protein AAF591_11690 [Verrucomicrobiota bacterium]
MKGFINFLIFAGGMAAILYFAWPYLKPRWEELRPQVEEFLAERFGEKGADGSEEAPGSAASPVREVVLDAPDAPADMPPPAPEPTTSEIDQMVEELYPAPDIKPLLALVGNWEAIPARVFPREVTIRVPVRLALVSAPGVGGSEMGAGEVLVAVSSSGRELEVAPTPDATVRGRVSVDETDFKERLEGVYDDFVEKRMKEVMAQREAERARIEESRREAKGSGQAWVPGTGYTDGSGSEFSAMKLSISRGEAGDRSLEEAKGWRWIGPDWVKGKQYESGMVRFETETIFGVFRNELKALHENGRVVRWVYPATNEPLQY